MYVCPCSQYEEGASTSPTCDQKFFLNWRRRGGMGEISLPKFVIFYETAIILVHFYWCIPRNYFPVSIHLSRNKEMQIHGLIIILNLWIRGTLETSSTAVIEPGLHSSQASYWQLNHLGEAYYSSSYHPCIFAFSLRPHVLNEGIILPLIIFKTYST